MVVVCCAGWSFGLAPLGVSVFSCLDLLRAVVSEHTVHAVAAVWWCGPCSYAGCAVFGG